MFVADFITGPGTDKKPCIIKISLLEYLQGKVNSSFMLKHLGKRLQLNLLNDYYYVGVRICL